MKRRVLGVIALLLSMSMLVVGCSSGSKGSTKEAEKEQSTGDKTGTITVYRLDCNGGNESCI